MAEIGNLDIISEYDRDEMEELIQVIESEGWMVEDIDFYKSMGQKNLTLDLIK